MKRSDPEYMAVYRKKHRKKIRKQNRECIARHKKIKKCPICKTGEVSGAGRKYCTPECSDEIQRRDANRRRRPKQFEFSIFKMYRGCDKCGYARCGSALDFHHDVPKSVLPERKKKCRVACNNYQTPAGKAEMAKCSLLCACCHREYHEMLNILTRKRP